MNKWCHGFFVFYLHVKGRIDKIYKYWWVALFIYSFLLSFSKEVLLERWDWIGDIVLWDGIKIPKGPWWLRFGQIWYLYKGGPHLAQPKK